MTSSIIGDPARLFLGGTPGRGDDRAVGGVYCGGPVGALATPDPGAKAGFGDVGGGVAVVHGVVVGAGLAVQATR